MHTRWISSTSLLLLLVFFFNTCVFGVVLSCMIYLHKESQKTSLHKPSKDIIELRMNADLVENYNTQFKWVKEWEFEYLGEMYDVVDSRKEGDKWVFNCKHDSREEILKKRADREAKSNQDSRDAQSKKNLKVHVVCFADCSSSEIHSVYTMMIPFESQIIFSCDSKNIPDPPPWFV